MRNFGDWLYDSFNSSQEAARLMAQCMADGHKEYECHAMLDKHTQVVSMPVVIPVRR